MRQFLIKSGVFLAFAGYLAPTAVQAGAALRLYTQYNKPEDPCAAAIAGQLPEILYKGAGSLLLAPHSQRYLVGALAETVSGQLYLATAPYRVQHESLLAAFDWSVDVSEIEPFRLVWTGELLIANATDNEAMGRVLFANETAGLYKRLCEAKNCPHANDVARLKELANLKPGFFAPNAVFETFEQSERKKQLHLLPGLDVFIHTLDTKFAAKEVEDDGSNYRHFVRNRVAGIQAELTYRLERSEGQPEYARRQVLLNHVTSLTDLQRECLQLYLGWFENDPKREEAALRLETYFARAERGVSLSLLEWNFVNELFEDLVLQQRAGVEAGDAMLTDFGKRK